MSSSDRSPATRAVHAGTRPRIEGAISTPIFQSSTFEYHGEDYHDVRYLRLSNSPNHRVVAEKIAALEGSEAALASASGMAAISGTLLTVLSAGDHMLVQDCLYGGTTGLLDHELPRFGITHTAIDPQNPSSWQAALTPTTRVMYVETLTNPLLQLADLEAVVAFARANGLTSIIDNTFASPINYRPAEHGFDLVIESCTKYMNGHSDLVAGSVAGPADLIERIRVVQNHLGGFLDAHACYMLERGLKTLAVRVRQQSETAGHLAAFLDGHPAVTRVNYPGLPSHEQHERAARWLDGFGGMFSFELEGGVEQAEDLLAGLTLPAVAASLGGAESLAVRPAAVVHAALTPEQRAEAGIADGLIRFSTGLEGTDDLLADLEQALSRVAAATV